MLFFDNIASLYFISILEPIRVKAISLSIKIFSMGFKYSKDRLLIYFYRSFDASQDLK